jgi:membrane protein implicated in regulation of membrane protease activity
VHAWHVWVIVAIALAAAEVFAPGFVLGPLGASALLAALVAGLGGSLTSQLLAFGLSAIVAVWLGRPFLERRLGGPAQPVRTNAAALVGRTGRVAQPIAADLPGRVVVDGDDWRAEAVSGGAIAAGARVRIVRIEGVTLFVEPA